MSAKNFFDSRESDDESAVMNNDGEEIKFHYPFGVYDEVTAKAKGRTYPLVARKYNTKIDGTGSKSVYLNSCIKRKLTLKIDAELKLELKEIR